MAEGVARGRIHCDSYAGLRALLLPASKRANSKKRRRNGPRLLRIEDAGRWTAISASPQAVGVSVHTDTMEHTARTLLRRYGVICWRLLDREAAWLPPWRDLVRIYRRLEARGEIRGGRFIAGLSGEQFALPEAIGMLREVRRQPFDGALVCLAAGDPANMLGSILPGNRIPRATNTRVLFQDGMAVATCVGKNIEWLQPIPDHLRLVAQQLLTLEPVTRRSRQLWLAAAA